MAAAAAPEPPSEAWATVPCCCAPSCRFGAGGLLRLRVRAGGGPPGGFACSTGWPRAPTLA
eukprot:530238-Alexandrium_andersonii.AAC.1